MKQGNRAYSSAYHRLSSKSIKYLRPGSLHFMLAIITILFFSVCMVQERYFANNLSHEEIKALETACDLKHSLFKDQSRQVQNCVIALLSRINEANEVIKLSTARLETVLKQSSIHFSVRKEIESVKQDVNTDQSSHHQKEQNLPHISEIEFQESLSRMLPLQPSKYLPSLTSPPPVALSQPLQTPVAKNKIDEVVCRKWLVEFGVKPRQDWGTLPKVDQQSWSTLNCDCILIGYGCPAPGANPGSRTLPRNVTRSITREGILAAVARRPPDSWLPCLSPPPTNAAAAPPHRCTRNAAAAAAAATAVAGRLPVVAVLVPTTSRGLKWANVNQSHVVTRSLPSLLRHAEAGFEYRFYVGYDSDDALYTRDDVRRDLVAWLQRALAAVPHPASAALAEFNNELRKPGPVFNFLSAAAAADGADYIYRINDDTKMLGPYAKALVQALQRMSPPLLGVAGPECKEGNQKILTHDFVHRTHLAVFGLHYPPSLPDWWMDDWISLIYPRNNTARVASAAVQHLTSNPRYEVNKENGPRLNAEVSLARQMLREYVNATCSAPSKGKPVGNGGVLCPPEGW